MSTIQVTVRFGSVPLQFRGRTLSGWSEASYLSSPSTNLPRGLAARRLFRVPHATKALHIFKHPCLLRDSNPVPKAQQKALLTAIPDGWQAQTSSSWCGVVDSSSVVLLTRSWFRMTRSIVKSPHVAQQCDVNIHSLRNSEICRGSGRLELVAEASRVRVLVPLKISHVERDDTR
ncbi:hypothetical protein TNCV_1391521 [Trichonephila clavipes]|nr:hypothetical protein TNCV_1391521 [Trichonephila clavipes]